MVNLYATVVELWPEQARLKLREKGLTRSTLRGRFKKVVFPGCTGYNDYRFFFNLQTTELPLFVVVLQCEKDAVAALDLLKDYGLTMRTINGRHSSFIMNPDFYLDVSAWNKIVQQKDTLRVGGGATQGMVYKFLFENSVQSHPMGFGRFFEFREHAVREKRSLLAPVFPGGSQGSVGATGVITNGGLGSFKRSFGLAVDHILGFRIALPPTADQDSRVVDCSEAENADLFWALRGCVGSNFGVVLEIRSGLLFTGLVIVYFLEFDWKDAARIISLWQEDAPSRPDAFNEDLNTFAYRDGQVSEKGISITGQYVVPFGQSVSDAESTIRQNLKLFLPLATFFNTRVQTYESTVQELSAGRVYYPFSFQRGVLSSKRVDPETIVAHIEKGTDIPGTHFYLLELLGGKISHQTPQTTAYFPRNADIWYDMSTFYHSVLDAEQNQRWFDGAFAFTYRPNDLQNTIFPGLPLNHLPNHLEAYYGTNAERLLQIKEKVDPLSLLRFPSGLVE